MLKDQYRSIAWFIVVGSVAAATHWLVVVWLVESLALHPLLSNWLGWLTAFVVSFSGHHVFTFRDHGVKIFRALKRFFLVSATGFAINETMYALLLHWSTRRYDILLALVLIAVAVATWLLSRHWAFADN